MSHQDYIGQDLIWRLRGIHPYEQNHEHFYYYYTPHTPRAHEEITNFILCHVKADWLSNVVKRDIVCKDGIIRNLITKIAIKNVFGFESIVEIELREDLKEY